MKLEVSYEEIESTLNKMLNKDIRVEHLTDSSINLRVLGCDFIIEINKVLDHKIILEYSTNIFGRALISALASMNSGISIPRSTILEIDLTEFHEFFSNLCLESVSFSARSIAIDGKLN